MTRCFWGHVECMPEHDRPQDMGAHSAPDALGTTSATKPTRNANPESLIRSLNVITTVVAGLAVSMTVVTVAFRFLQKAGVVFQLWE